jgi:hypothetical protein
MRHDQHLVSYFEEIAPQATPQALSIEPDFGETYLVIPVMLTEPGSLREKNFKFLIDYYVTQTDNIIVVEQVNEQTTSAVSDLADVYQNKLVHIKVDSKNLLVEKCTLVNKGSVFAFEERNARYVWQVDADILVFPRPTFRHLSVLNSDSVPVIKPYTYFARLSETLSESLLAMSPQELQDYEPPWTSSVEVRFETLIGPGSLIFSGPAFREIGGMDESYSGWGWEDIDYAERLTEKYRVHTLPLRGVHLHHEEDRRRNRENAVRFFDQHRSSISSTERARILASTSFWNLLRKLCVIDMSINRVKERDTLISTLAIHPEITDFTRELKPKLFSHDTNSSEAGIFYKILSEILGTAESDFCSLNLTLEELQSYSGVLASLSNFGFKFILFTFHELDSSTDLSEFGSSRKRLLKDLSANALRNGTSIGKMAIEINNNSYTDDIRQVFPRIENFLGLKSSFSGNTFM